MRIKTAITIKMKTIVRKHLMIRIIKLRLRNLDNKHLKKAGGHIGWNLVEITIKMKTIVRKPLMIKITKLCLRNLDNKHLKKARRTYRPNCCGNNNKDEDNSPKTLNNKNPQASSQKFRQLVKYSENYQGANKPSLMSLISRGAPCVNLRLVNGQVHINIARYLHDGLF